MKTTGGDTVTVESIMVRSTARNVIGLLLIVAGAFMYRSHFISESSHQSTSLVPTVSNLTELLSLSPESLQKVDIARMNLLCAEGLPGAEGLNVENSLAVLDQMAARVKSETERHYYRFKSNPAEFENSEGFFRMLMLGVVLTEDFRVHYSSDKRVTSSEANSGDGFFADARDVFVCGLTGPGRSGTCSSLPVLKVAIGLRLGYPLKLVTTKGHLFIRWEDAHERFNIEAARNGVNRFRRQAWSNKTWSGNPNLAEVHTTPLNLSRRRKISPSARA